MRRPGTVAAEVVGSLDDPAAEMVVPHAIGDRSPGEHVLRAREPVGQRGPPAALVVGMGQDETGRQARKARQAPRTDGLAGLLDVSPPQHGDGPRGVRQAPSRPVSPAGGAGSASSISLSSAAVASRSRAKRRVDRSHRPSRCRSRSACETAIEQVVARPGGGIASSPGARAGCRIRRPDCSRPHRPASIESSAETVAFRARSTPPEMTSSSPSANT